MISRPVAATLGCCGCRQAILRAVASRPLAGIGQSASRGIRPVASSGFRGFATNQQFGTAAQSNAEAKTGIEELRDEEDIVDSNAEDADTPWFLDVEPPRRAPLQHIASLPKVPEDAPPLLEPMMKYIYEDMGLDELSMLDLRELDPPAALGPNLIMIFGTARSERHLHISAGRFVRWLRKNHQVGARADGLIGPGELKTKLRRLRKKAKMLGTNTMIMPGSDNGISTGWVCVNFSAHDHGAQESHSYDESGRFSGFGTPLTGTTVVVQCMTESRRNELDLETLWRGILKRNMEEMQKVKGKKVVDPSELESMVSAKIQMPDSPSAQQPLLRAPDSPKLDLTTLRRHIHDIQVAGTPVSRDIFQSLVSAIFQAEVTAEDTAPARLALVDQLSLMAEERGLSVMSKDWLITLIEAIVTSPAYGPELQRAQKNVEYLLSTKQRSALKTSEILRLMAAYAHQPDWDKFWDAFRSPARFLLPRSPELYEYAYRVMAATGDRKLCTDALRWVYPEMLKEEPKIWPVGALYTSLKACILAADPSAENLLHHPPPQDGLDLFGQRQLAHREFVRVLKEVENMRQHYANAQAREHSAQTLRHLSGQMPSSNN
ncbi:hypothetical protein TgHK011_003094 [Trichoderma gracile]|nr:hypothetical protein TgHK011_003094 [Trichoderma gracile]